jgi:hypothetical protein
MLDTTSDLQVMKREELLFGLILGATILGFAFLLGHKAKPKVEDTRVPASKPALRVPNSGTISVPKTLSDGRASSLFLALNS